MRAIGILFIAVMVAGCVSSSLDAGRERQHAGLNDREILTLEAVLHWYQHYRNPKFAYRFDERDSAFSQEVKERLSAEIPEFRPDGDDAWYYVSVPKIVFPEAPFGYAEVVIGDAFYAERYVEVFERRADGWQVIDSVTIASGTLDSILTEFDWPSYFRDMKKKPNQPTQRNAGSRPSSADSPASETPSSLGPRG